MSLESALDEERREIMALLEGRPQRVSSPARAQSPAAAKSPVRSMLDIGGPPPPARPSMLDVGGPPPTATRHMSIAAPVVKGPLGGGVRSPSASSASPPPQIRTALGSSPRNPEDAYQFEMLPTIEAHSMPKRVTQGGKKKKQPTQADEILEAVRDRGRHGSAMGLLGKHKSSSPAPAGGRSASPGGRKLNTNSLNLMPSPNKYVSESGKIVDMNNAYRRLSDAALLRSGGSLSHYSSRKASDAGSRDHVAPDGGVRLEKDYYADDDEDAVASSEEEKGLSGSSDEEWTENKRGRRRHRQKDDDDDDDDKASRSPKSLLAAAEDERKYLALVFVQVQLTQRIGLQVSSKYQYRSLLEPTVTVTGPDGEKMAPKRTGVHPNTNFDDEGGSAVGTPVNSDTEADISDIKRAQRLAMNISNVQSNADAHRCVRQVIRGEYRDLQKEAEQGFRRQRVYLVATDISEEAAYALEWTIGTVLRDGDTLLAVYAIDEEQIGSGQGESTTTGVTAAQEANSLAKTLSHDGDDYKRSPGPSRLRITTPADDPNAEPDYSSMEKAERQRYKAVMEISDRCVKLLRKTRLQVRVVVEVFHCKSPKHMITEVVSLYSALQSVYIW